MSENCRPAQDAQATDRVCAAPREGRLFYVVGTSDGKNRLLAYARAQLSDHHALVFAHRYVVSTNRCVGEHEICLTDVEFDLRSRYGLFAMAWESGGWRYGIGHEINYWLAKGLSVVMKGSRAYLGQAVVAYPDMTVIYVVTDKDTDESPVKRRARKFRLELTCRAVDSQPGRYGGLRIVQVSADGALPIAGERLVTVLAGNVA